MDVKMDLRVQAGQKADSQQISPGFEAATVPTALFARKAFSQCNFHSAKGCSIVSVVRTISPCLILAFLASAAKAADGDSAAFFETRVRPLLARECYVCHTA